MSVLKNAIKLYFEGIEQGNYIDAIETYATSSYKQHSTGVKTGSEGFKEFFAEFTTRFPKREFQIFQAFEQDNLAFLMVLQTLNDKKSWVTMDIFKGNEDSKIMEHWDIIEKYEDFYQVEGAFEIEENDFDLVGIIYENTVNFDQFIYGVKSHSMNKYTIKNLKVHQSLRKGNFVAILGEFIDGIGYASMNLLRFEGEQLVEYWDVIEPIPSIEIAKNSGKF